MACTCKNFMTVNYELNDSTIVIYDRNHNLQSELILAITGIVNYVRRNLNYNRKVQWKLKHSLQLTIIIYDRKTFTVEATDLYSRELVLPSDRHYTRRQYCRDEQETAGNLNAKSNISQNIEFQIVTCLLVMQHFAESHLADRHLARRVGTKTDTLLSKRQYAIGHLPHRHWPYRHLAYRHLAYRHLAYRHLAYRHLACMNLANTVFQKTSWVTEI